MQRRKQVVTEVEYDGHGEARSLAGINFLLAIWLIISPFILNYVLNGAIWNQVVFGVVVLILSALRYIFPRLRIASWLVGLVGLWMIAAPFVIDYSVAAAYWNEVIVGIVIAIIAFSNVGPTVHRRTTTTTT